MITTGQAHKKVNLWRLITGQRETTVFLVIIFLSVILSIVSKYYLTGSNLSTTALGLSSDGVIAIGMCIVLLTGGIDLSVGSVMAASMVITGMLYIDFGLSIWLTAGIALLFATFCGFINGILIGKIGLNPMITTLGMMNMTRGIAYVITRGSPISLPAVDPNFVFLGAGKVFGVPMFVIIFISIAIIFHFLLNNVTVMRKVLCTGSNEKAAKLSGINTARIKLGVYMTSAALAGVAGVLSLSRFKVATPNTGIGTEMRVISACIIGGTSLIGGEGSILGAVLGVLMLNIINNGLVLLNVSVYWQDLISGAILITAVTVDFMSQKNKAKKRIQKI